MCILREVTVGHNAKHKKREICKANFNNGKQNGSNFV